MDFNKIATIRFWSGCIPEDQEIAWCQAKEQWARNKLATLCVAPCEYVQFSKCKRTNEVCPKGQTSVRITIRAYCMCPEGHVEYPEEHGGSGQGGNGGSEGSGNQGG